MDLWTTLQGISANGLPGYILMGLAVVVGVVAFALACDGVTKVTAYLSRVATVIAAAAAVSGTVLLFNAVEHASDQRRDAVAAYLEAEHDLIALSPIEIRNGCSILEVCDQANRYGATTTAVGKDGTVYDVKLTWLPLDLAPQDPTKELPDAMQAVTATITAR